MLVAKKRLFVQCVRIGIGVVVIVFVFTGRRSFQQRYVQVEVFVVYGGAQNLVEALDDLREVRSFLGLPVPALSHHHVPFGGVDVMKFPVLVYFKSNLLTCSASSELAFPCAVPLAETRTNVRRRIFADKVVHRRS